MRNHYYLILLLGPLMLPSAGCVSCPKSQYLGDDGLCHSSGPDGMGGENGEDDDDDEGPILFDAEEEGFDNFEVSGGEWGHTELTWCLSTPTTDMDESDLEAAIQSAADTWGEVSPLIFTQLSTCAGADLIVLFGANEHGDGIPFDGDGGVLAHAYYPEVESNYDGDAHFDDDEDWTDEERPSSSSPRDLITVALHEFGHSLGLRHSAVEDAVMYAYYGGSNRDLHSDDIAGIQSIYGDAEGGGGGDDDINLDPNSPSLSNSSPDAGDAITVSGTLSNDGTVPSGSFEVAVYLSTDTTGSERDTVLASWTESSISAGGSTSYSESVTIPTSASAGSHYIIVVADPDDDIAESDESDNSASRSVSVYEPGPDYSTVGCSDSAFSSVVDGVEWALANGLTELTVCPGTYSESDCIEISDSFALRSTGGSGATELQVSDSSCALRIDPNRGDSITVEGFTISNGWGPGVYFMLRSSVYYDFAMNDFVLQDMGAAFIYGSVGEPTNTITIMLSDGTVQYNWDGAAFGSNMDVIIDSVDFLYTADSAITVGYAGMGEETTITMIDSSIVGSNYNSAGSALVFMDSSEGNLTNVTISDNECTSTSYGAAGAIFLSSGHIGTVALTNVDLLRNTSASSSLAGGATIHGGELVCSNCDWGSGADDNDPYDVRASGQYNYGSGASFTCTTSGCD